MIVSIDLRNMLPFKSTETIPYRIGLGIACVGGAIGGIYLAYQATKHIR